MAPFLAQQKYYLQACIPDFGNGTWIVLSAFSAVQMKFS